MSAQSFSIQRKFPELMLNRQLAKSVFVLYDCDCLISLLVSFIPISRYTAYHMFFRLFSWLPAYFSYASRHLLPILFFCVAPCQQNKSGGVLNHTQNLKGSNH